MYPELCKFMAAKKIDSTELARIAGIKQQTMSTRLSGKSQFKLPEMIQIRDYLKADYPTVTLDQLFERNIILF